MNEKLIEALLDCRVCFHDCAYCGNNQEICCGSTDDLIDATADAIELLTGQLAALQSENGSKDKEVERLQAKAIQWRKTSEENFASCEKLQATLSRVEAERDAAMKDVPHDCEHCKTGDCYIRNGTEHCHWLWRGAQGEG